MPAASPFPTLPGGVTLAAAPPLGTRPRRSLVVEVLRGDVPAGRRDAGPVRHKRPPPLHDELRVRTPHAAPPLDEDVTGKGVGPRGHEVAEPVHHKEAGFKVADDVVRSSRG